jgi:hypothetical protein
MAEDYVTVDAHRSRYFGPNGKAASAGARADIPGIAEAQPPSASGPPTGQVPRAAQRVAPELAARLPARGAGSNAIAVGRAGTRDQR